MAYKKEEPKVMIEKDPAALSEIMQASNEEITQALIVYLASMDGHLNSEGLAESQKAQALLKQGRHIFSSPTTQEELDTLLMFLERVQLRFNKFKINNESTPKETKRTLR